MDVLTLAASKKLDPQWLREQGVDDLPGGGVSIAYLDADGGELFRRKRDVPGGRKRFDQPYRVPLRPYGLWRLADMDGSTRLHVCEGESDCWPLWAEGMHAVGLPGSDSASCLQLADLGGASTLILCPDGDQAGARFRDGVVRRLAAVGFGGQVYAVAMPPGAKDVCDFRALDPATFPARFRGLLAAAEQVFGAPAEPESVRPQPLVITLEDVTAEPIEWLWQDWMPLGALAVLDGDPGLGKSSLTLDLAARLSNGTLGGAFAGRPVASMLLGAEDSLAHTVRPRLDAMGADCKLIHAFEGVINDPAKPDDVRPVILPGDLKRLADRIATLGVRLVVVDPLMAYLSSETDAHKDQDVRRCLRPLAALAEQLRITVLLVRHLNKLSGGPALYRGGSSIGITGAARASLIVGRDPEQDRHVLAMNKINVAPKPPSLAYRLEGRGMACRVVWGEEVDYRADQILGHGGPPRGEPGQGRGTGPGRPPTARDKARTFLADLLAGGPVLTAEVFRRAEAAGISPATLTRARADLGVVPEREGHDTYYMKLPDATHNMIDPPTNRDGETDLTNDDDLGYDQESPD